MNPYRESQRTANPKPYKALVRVMDSDGLGFWREAGFYATHEEASRAAQAEAVRIDREIPSNRRLERDNCRPVSIDWGTALYPYLDADGRPVKE